MFCKYTDLRANVLERNSTSRGDVAFQAIMHCIDKNSLRILKHVFQSKKNQRSEYWPYRDWLKKINRWGGRKFMEAFTVAELSKVYYSFLKEVEKNKGDL